MILKFDFCVQMINQGGRVRYKHKKEHTAGDPHGFISFGTMIFKTNRRVGDNKML